MSEHGFNAVPSETSEMGGGALEMALTFFLLFGALIIGLALLFWLRSRGSKQKKNGQ